MQSVRFLRLTITLLALLSISHGSHASTACTYNNDGTTTTWLTPANYLGQLIVDLDGTENCRYYTNTSDTPTLRISFSDARYGGPKAYAYIYLPGNSYDSFDTYTVDGTSYPSGSAGISSPFSPLASGTTYTFAGSYTDSSGNFYSVTTDITYDSVAQKATFSNGSVTLTPGPSLSPSTQSISAVVGSAITNTNAFTASNFGGTPTYSVSPALPTGLSLNSTTGVISGTPTAAQSAATYTITGSDGSDSSTATVSITITANPVLSPASQTVSVTPNTPITPTNALSASGFSGTVSYSVSPSLPTGLSMSSSTGVISGTPITSQSAITYTITGTYSSETASASISISVANNDPLIKKDVLGNTEATSNSGIKFVKNSVKPINNRLSWLRQNKDSSQTSRQGIKVSFADPLLESYVNGTQSGLDSLSFDEKGAASALAQVASNTDAAASSLKEKPVEVMMAEMKDIFGTVNLNPTAGALVGDWSVWTEGQITVGKVDATSTSSNQDSDSFNIAVGMDRDYGDLGLMGVALNLGKDDVDVGSSGSGIQSNNISLSFYNAKMLPNSLGLETQVGIGKMSIDTTRIDGSQTLTGDRDAQMLFGSIALVDEPLKHGSATLTPYARGEWAYIELDSYAESGGSLALNYDKQHINRYMVFLGSDVSYDTTFANGKLKPFAAFEYGLDLTRDSDVSMNYVGGSTTYSTQLEKTATSNVMVRLGADYQGKDGTTSSVAFERNEAIGAGFSNSLRLQVSVPLH